MTEPTGPVQARIEITDVARDPDAEHLLAGWAIDLPAAGEQFEQLRFPIGGWTVGRRAQVVEVQVQHLGATIADGTLGTPRPDVSAALPHIGAGEASGFSGYVTVVGLPAQFELDLVVRLSDGSLIRLGTVAGRHTPLPPVTTALNPLVITSLGRTGTTLMLHTLGHHPQVVRHPIWPYELEAVPYFARRFRTESNHPHGIGQPAVVSPWQVGGWWGLDHPYAVPAMERYLGTEQIVRSADRAVTDCVAFYQEMARQQSRPDARYFAEKFLPNTAQFPLDRFAGAREIILVRDFRDMIASILQFNRHRGVKDFLADQAPTDADLPVVHQLSVQRLLDAARSRPAAMVVRYEDMVRQPEQTFQQLFASLAIAADPVTAAAVLEAAQSASAPVAGHRTSASDAVSIGRWRADLAPEVAAACQTEFAEALAYFDYA